MKLSTLLFPPPFQARHAKRTFVSSPDDEASRPSRELIETALDCVRATLDVSLDDLRDRIPDYDWDPDLWPGEHYRLLKGIVTRLQPRNVIEIGTETGLSALCMRRVLPEDGVVTTFDLLDWKTFNPTCLREEDFTDGRLKQELADLSDPEVFERHRALFESADFIFADGPKDGFFEPAFARLLDTVRFQTPPHVLFDDIRDRNMLRFWRELPHPKLDLSSFGHWTGTGLVRWGGGGD